MECEQKGCNKQPYQVAWREHGVHFCDEHAKKNTGLLSQGQGWHGDTLGHRDAAFRGAAGRACNTRMKKEEKKEENKMGELHHIKLDELIDSAKPTMHKMLDQALTSGALSEDYKEDNFLLPKAIITIWGRKENYAPLNPQDKKEVKNLENFI